MWGIPFWTAPSPFKNKVEKTGSLLSLLEWSSIRNNNDKTITRLYYYFALQKYRYWKLYSRTPWVQGTPAVQVNSTSLQKMDPAQTCNQDLKCTVLTFSVYLLLNIWNLGCATSTLSNQASYQIPTFISTMSPIL